MMMVGLVVVVNLMDVNLLDVDGVKTTMDR